MAEVQRIELDIPAKPTNFDLAAVLKHVIEKVDTLHDCLEDHRKNTTAADLIITSEIKAIQEQLPIINTKQNKTAVEITKLRKTALATAKNIKKITDAQFETGSHLEELKNKFEAKKGRDKPLVFMGQMELAIKGFGLVTVAIGVWKFIAFSIPYFIPWVLALYGHYVK